MDYEYKGSIIHTFYPIRYFWCRPIDWLENLGMYTPTPIFMRFDTNQTGTFGSYYPSKDEIVISRDNHTDWDVTLVHELVHSWQNRHGYLIGRGGRPKAYRDYLAQPHEEEAFWWSNQYSLETGQGELKVAGKYRELGFSSF